jgi:hypothetical protein
LDRGVERRLMGGSNFVVIFELIGVVFPAAREVKMNVGNRSAARRAFGGRLLYGRLLAVSASATLLCGSSAALAGPCRLQIVQLERQISIDLPPPVAAYGSVNILPQSLDAQLHHQPTLDTVVQALHYTYKDGNDELDRAWKADSEGDVERCSQSLVEARRLYGLKD